MNQILPLPVQADGPRMRPILVRDLLRMIEAGIFAREERVELIEGQLVEMSPIGHPHIDAVNRLTKALVLAVGDRAVVSIQNPVELDDRTRPQPDAALLRPRPKGYARAGALPEDILLLVEVADTSLDWDRGDKRLRYARSGIVEAWVVRLDTLEIEVARRPSANGYRSVETFGADAVLEIEALPGIAVAARDCLPFFGPEP